MTAGAHQGIVVHVDGGARHVWLLQDVCEGAQRPLQVQRCLRGCQAHGWPGATAEQLCCDLTGDQDTSDVQSMQTTQPASTHSEQVRLQLQGVIEQTAESTCSAPLASRPTTFLSPPGNPLPRNWAAQHCARELW